MDFLKRELAPIVEQAWSEIERQAVRVLEANLSARRVVDFVGPKGFDYSSVNLGKLEPKDEAASEGVRYGIRKVLPLAEVRVPFELNVWDLDNLSRGAADLDLEPLVQAALRLAQFEERVVYHGFAPAGFEGLAHAAGTHTAELGGEARDYPDAVASATIALADRGVGGPYALVLGPVPYRKAQSDVSVYSPKQRIEKMIGGPVLLSPVLEGGFLVSLRGGDFELTVGQDASIGYQHHDSKHVSLYLTETLAFRVIDPEAVVLLR
jgi:uncharacterized linocin/CFP29 family protein